jgi:uncharacterized coiled-coil protein SlyX
MATLGERVVFLERQMAEQTHAFTAIRDSLAGFEGRFDRLDQRADRLEQRVDRLGERINRLDDKMSRQFLWIVGIQITTLVAVVGAVLLRA